MHPIIADLSYWAARSSRNVNTLVTEWRNDGPRNLEGANIVTRPAPTSELIAQEAMPSADAPGGHGVVVSAGLMNRMPTINRVVSLMPGFVYVFNHTTYSNDYTNRSVGEHLGYSSQEIRAFGNQMLMQLVHPDDMPLLGAHMDRIAKLADDETATLEYRVTTKQGEERWLRSVDTVFDRAADKSVLRHIGCASDVTLEKRAVLRMALLNAELEDKVAQRTLELASLNSELENRIAARTHELQEAVDELEHLTYIATHDLKVPVNNLCRLGIMLRETAHVLEDDQAEQVGWINDCADQLSAKIQGLVRVAEIRLNEIPPAVPVALGEAVSAALANCRETVGGRPLEVLTAVPEDMVVLFEHGELEGILAALLDNALKYADPDRPLQIRIAASLEADHVALTVSDNGSGIDEERDRGKVFGLFQRAHKEPPGSGISLYCARRLMQLRGGEITVCGERGRGAEVRLKFPMYFSQQEVTE